MLRCLIPLVFLPATAMAEWSPHPSLFRYDASFARCTADPAAPDLARTCAAHLTHAYTLKRAVARAVLTCSAPLPSQCPEAFEAEGLPAIAAEIAVQTGCDATLSAERDLTTPLPAELCTSVISDILLDEGVVPLDKELACGDAGDECAALAQVQVQLWDSALAALENGPLSDPTVNDLIQRIAEECQSDGPSGPCKSDGLSRLWRDLVQEQ